jgi:hypothetical protein
MPEVEQSTANDAMVKSVVGLVELAVTYPPAHAELMARSAELRQLIIAAPQRAPIPKVEVYLEICARIACEPDTLALLREVTARAPAATGLRNRLLHRQLRAMHARRLYGDINANRDLLNTNLDLSVEMTKYFVEQATLTAVALYEAALATGDAAEANQAAERALAFKASDQMLEKLIEAAARVGRADEVERLKGGVVKADEPKLR